MAQIRIGVIGCGSIAKNRHLPEYDFHPDAIIAAVCDIVPERAEETAGKYGAAAYTDFETMLKEADIDAVSVCTPNVLHAPMSIAALKAGKHVLCEKPMAVSAEEAESMIKAAEASGRKLMIAHNQRFVPSHQKAREMIENGELGRIYSFRTSFGHGGPEGWSADGADSWFFKKDQAFIGAMGDLGVHKADLLRYLLGEEFTEAAAFIETTAKENADVDDTAAVILKTESKIVGTLAASWSYRAKEDNSTVLYGEKAILRLEDDPEHSLIIHYTDGKTVKQQLGAIQTNETDGQLSDSGVISRFLESIIQDKEPAVSGEEGLKSLKVILAALESSRTKQVIRI